MKIGSGSTLTSGKRALSVSAAAQCVVTRRPDTCPCRKLNLAGNYRIGRCSCLMREVRSLIWLALVGAFRSRVSLEAENTILRHQLNVLRRKSPKRPTFGMLDRLIFAGLYRLAPKVLGALAIVKPETVIKWHRAGFRSSWRWKSRRRGGRPTVAPEIRKLIRTLRSMGRRALLGKMDMLKG